MQDLLDRFSTCATKKEAIEFAMSCSPEERAFLNGASLRCLQGKYTGITGKTSLVVPLMEIPEGASYKDIMNSKATAQDAEEVYKQLFEHIAKALIEARKAGKPLSIHVGEMHPDRGSQMMNLMVLNIAKHLGITHMGFEAYEQELNQQTSDGRTVTLPAFNRWQEYHRQHAINGIMPDEDETLSPQSDNTLINKQELIAVAQNNGFTTFPVDKPTDMTTPQDIYWERERYMLERVAKQAPHNDAVIFGGSGHLYGFNELTKNADTRAMCFIKTEQHLFLTPTPSFHDDETFPRYTFPAFQPLLKTGRVHNFPDAHQLAQTASQNLEETHWQEQTFAKLLAEAEKEAPTAELTAINFGGRTPEQQERRRG